MRRYATRSGPRSLEECRLRVPGVSRTFLLRTASFPQRQSHPFVTRLITVRDTSSDEKSKNDQRKREGGERTFMNMD